MWDCRCCQRHDVLRQQSVVGLYVANIFCCVVINLLKPKVCCYSCFLKPEAQVLALYSPVIVVAVINIVIFMCICCVVDNRDNFTHAPLNTTNNNNNIRDTPFDDSSVALTSPSHPTDVIRRSYPDLQYKPYSQVLGIALVLLLFLVTWASAALSVVPVFDFHLQDVAFKCVYLFASCALGVFMLVFFVLGRRDGRRCWYDACCAEKSEELSFQENPNFIAMTPQSSTNGVHARNSIATSSLTNRVPTRNSSSANGYALHTSSARETDASHATSNQTRSQHRPISSRTARPSHFTPLHENSRPQNSQQSTPLLAYAPLYPRAPDKSNSVTSFPLTETSITALSQQYPSFYNERQNGVAQKYWRKRRLKQSLVRANKELRAYDSDTSAPVLPKQANASAVPPVTTSNGNTHIGPPMSRDAHNEIAPMVGLSSPPSVVNADGESHFDVANNKSVLLTGVPTSSVDAERDTKVTMATTSFISAPQAVKRTLKTERSSPE